MHNLAVCYSLTHRLSEASALYQQELTIQQGLPNQTKVNIDGTLRDLARVARSDGRTSEASKWAAQLRTRLEARLADDIATTMPSDAKSAAALLRKRAILCNRIGQFTEASAL